MKLWIDIKYALRLLKKTPGFSFLSLTVTALGVAIALYTATIAYEFTMRPPPFPAGDRFAVIKMFTQDTNQQRSPTANSFLRNRLAQSNQSFDVLGALTTDFAVFTDGDTSQQYYAGIIEPALLNMTEKTPLLGRQFSDADASANATPVVMLGFDVWQNYFAGDPNIVGAKTTINGVSTTIVGVMPEDFQIALPHQLWLPAIFSSVPTVEEANAYQLIGAIKVGTTFEQSSADLNTVISALAEEYPSYFQDRYIEAQPIGLIDSSSGDGEWMFVVVAALIMLLTAINLSAMLFVRANTRQRELSVRSAVGADKWEIIKQVLLESFILCFVGSLIAVGLADIALRTIEFDSPINLMGQSWRELWIHPIELAIAIGMMICVWLISGLATVVRLLRQDIVIALEGSQGSGTSRALNYTTHIIVGVELVSAFFILIACGTLTATIVNTYNHDYGVNSEKIVTAQIGLHNQNYQDPSVRLKFIEALTQQLSAGSIFEAVSVATAPPGSFATPTNFVFADREVSPDEPLPRQGLVSVSPNYFDMMNVEIIEGRSFLNTDTVNGERVVIIDENFARQYWPNESALGKQIKVGSDNEALWHTVVGVNKHIVQGLPITTLLYNPSVYVPQAQHTPKKFFLVVRTKQSPIVSSVALLLNQSIAEIDRNVPVESIYTLAYRQRAALTAVGAGGKIFAFISIAALALSIIGIYGVISRSVTLRASEIGIRQALGSNKLEISYLFLKQGIWYLIVGLIFGGGLGVLVSRQFTSLSANAVNYIPGVFIVVALCLGLLVFLASYLPTKHILAKDPGDALRHE
jgi:predicted permease